MKEILIGIDVGISGAIAFLSDDLSLVDVIDMPVMAGTGKRQQVNGAELVKIINTKCLVPNPDTKLNYVPVLAPLVAFVERVSAMPGQGVSSMFSFGTSYGIVLGVLAALQIPVILVPPKTWKKRAGITGKEKDYARTLAQQFYPAAELGRKKDIGRADAILIARFGELQSKIKTGNDILGAVACAG